MAINDSRTLRLAAGGSLLLGAGALSALPASATTTSSTASTTSTTVAASSISPSPLPPTAQTFVVDSLADTTPAVGANCHPNAPVAGACTLRDAITDANTFNVNYGTSATITFSPTISGTIALTESLPMLHGSTTITGPGSATLTIDGGKVAAGFVQEPIPGPTPHTLVPIDLEVTGLTLRGLTSTSGAFNTTAIDLFSGNLTVRNCVVTDSGSQAGTAGFLGIAPITAGLITYLFRFGQVESIVIDGVDVAYNVGHNSSTSNVTSGSMITFAHSIDVRNSTFRHNSGQLAGGPILFGQNISVADSSMTDNSATQLGGLAVIGTSIDIHDTSITGNTSGTQAGLLIYGGYYGGVDITGPDSIAIRDTSVSNNSSLYGAVSRIDSSHALLDRVTMVGNSSAGAPRGLAGGSLDTASNDYQSVNLRLDTAATIESSTIAANHGLGIGVGALRPHNTTGSMPSALESHRLLSRLLDRGGVGPSAPPTTSTTTTSTSTTTTTLPVIPTATLHLSHSTVALNDGGGIGQDLNNHGSAITPADVVLDHALVAGNGFDDISVPSTARFSLLQRPTVTPVAGAGGGNLLGVDPQFRTTALPIDCPTDLVCVVPIDVGTPAWDAGDPDFVPPPLTDQRGEKRVVNVIDIGAYENQTEVVIPAFAG